MINILFLVGGGAKKKMKKTKKILLLSLTALFINIIPINLVFSYGISTTSNYDGIPVDSDFSDDHND